MKFEEYVQHDALGLAELVRQGEVQPSELVTAALSRADAVQPKLNALVRRMDEEPKARREEEPRRKPEAVTELTVGKKAAS